MQRHLCSEALHTVLYTFEPCSLDPCFRRFVSCSSHRLLRTPPSPYPFLFPHFVPRSLNGHCLPCHFHFATGGAISHGAPGENVSSLGIQAELILFLCARRSIFRSFVIIVNTLPRMAPLPSQPPLPFILPHHASGTATPHHPPVVLLPGGVSIAAVLPAFAECALCV
ncbi:unnamed protein product [Trypanosoma congolense IL3000]|uniref:WGS project CAEQ00000000 data, annotated contig 1900 n=1 Tax=Trypanosoma congolense (strain IL3000) TaxID=1068625 RepID=F9W9V1_TRYCI|nr:unnamed protein product [Trypanosoma congolense IL3000]